MSKRLLEQHSGKRTRKGLAGSLLSIVFFFLFLPVFPCYGAVDETCINAEGAQDLHDWMQDLVKAPALAALQNFDLTAEQTSARFTFHLPENRKAEINVTADRNGSLVFAFGASESNWRLELEAAMKAHPPPRIFFPCRNKTQERENSALTPHPMNWIYLPLVFLPLLLAIILIIRWRKRDSGPAFTRLDWLVFIFGAALLLLHISQSLSWPIKFDMDCGRDMASALLFAQGDEFLLQGPAIRSGNIHIGPFYHSILGLQALLSENIDLWFILPAAMHLLTLCLGFCFLRRHASLPAATIFIILWSGNRLVLENMSYISHNYLAFPLIALFIWVTSDMLRDRRSALFPLAALLIGMAVQVYAIFSILYAALLLVLYRGKLRPSLKQWLGALALSLVVHAFTLGLLAIDIVDGGKASSIIGDPPPAMQISIMHFLAGLWKVFSGVQPLAGGLFSTLIAAMVAGSIAPFLFRGKTSKGEAPASLQVLISCLALPLPLALIFHADFIERYFVVFLPTVTLLCAMGGGTLIQWIPLRLTPLQLWALLIVVFGAIALKQILAPQPFSTEEIDRGDQQAIAGEMRRMGLHTPTDLASRAHGSILHSDLTGLSVLLVNAAPYREQNSRDERHLWLTREVEDLDKLVLGETALIGKRGRFRISSYQPYLNYNDIEVHSAALSRPKIRFPMRNHHSSAAVRLFYTHYSQKMRPEEIPVINEEGKDSGLRIRVGARAPLSRPLRLVYERGCRVLVFASGKELKALSRATQPYQPIQIIDFAPLGERVPVMIEVDMSTCYPRQLDLFELPITQ